MRLSSAVRCIFAAGIAASVFAADAQQAETAFTYQGILKDGGANLDGTADLQLRLFDDEVGGVAREEVTLFGVPVENGLFTVEVDFGNDVLITPNAWIEIGVRNVMTGGGFTTLGQRQKLASSLYSAQQRGLRSSASGTSAIADPATGEGVYFEKAADGPLIRTQNGSGTTTAMLDEDGFGGIFQLFSSATGNLGVEMYTSGQFLNAGGEFNLYPADGSNATVLINSDRDFNNTNGSSDARMVLGSNSGSNGADILIDNATGNIGLELFGGASGGGSVRVRSENGGERLRLWEDNGNGGIIGFAPDGTNIFRLSEDPSSGVLSGSLALAGGQGTSTVSLDGDFGGTGDPFLFLNGAMSDVVLNTSSAGNAAVSLPLDAIGRFEIEDEPGVAAATASGVSVSSADGETNILSRTITCPASGYVVVIATAEASRTHFTGTASRAEFGVSDVSGSTPGGSQDVEWIVTSALPSGGYDIPATVHGVFSVSAGANTFYMVASNPSGGGLLTLNDVSMTCLYIPTAYGTVSSAEERGAGTTDELMAARGPMTNEDILAEQLQAQQQEIVRLQTEMQEYQTLRSEMAELRAAVNAMAAPVKPSSQADHADRGE